MYINFENCTVEEAVQFFIDDLPLTVSGEVDQKQAAAFAMISLAEAGRPEEDWICLQEDFNKIFNKS